MSEIPEDILSRAREIYESAWPDPVTAIAEALMEASQQWQPIVNAPEKGEFLAYGSYLYPGDKSETKYIMIAEKTGLRDWPYESGEGQHPANFFSHWQPLPKPPEALEAHVKELQSIVNENRETSLW